MDTLLLIVVCIIVGYFAGRLFTRPTVRYIVQPASPSNMSQPADDAATNTSQPPGQHARNTAEFVRELAALADRLAAQNICVYYLTCDYGGFGSWEIQVENGSEADRAEEARAKGDLVNPPDVTRVVWDGMEHILRGAVSPRSPLSAPVNWRMEFEEIIGSDGDQIGLAESYLITRFGK